MLLDRAQLLEVDEEIRKEGLFGNALTEPFEACFAILGGGIDGELADDV